MKSALTGLLLATGSSLALNLNVNDTSSVNSAARSIVDHIISRYNGTNESGTPGLFSPPYYWWESGLTWDAMVNYWAQTGDATYNDIVNEAMSWQVGPDFDYMPPNQTKSEGNDDQSFWAFAAMTAAEQGFPAPAGSLMQGKNLTWLQLAQNVFDSQAARWDTTSCGGGLKWQIFSFNNGYNYKNSFSTGNFYQLASRLALYTGNSTYSDWAQRALDWSVQVGLVDEGYKRVFDGTGDTMNCSQINHIQWTSAAGTYLSGASYLQNYSSTKNTAGPVFALFVGMDVFFEDGIMYEVACAPNGNCNVDQLAFKAVASRALARARDLTSNSDTTINGTSAGTLHQRINTLIESSAKGAAGQCSGGDSGSVCGINWNSTRWDGSQGLGQDLSALEIILATLPGKQLRNANTTTPGASGSTSTSLGGSNGTITTGGNASSTSGEPVAQSTNSASGLSGSLVALTLAVGFAVVGFAA